MDDRCVELIDRLKEMRKKEGYTQMKLAEITHLTQPQLARIESKTGTPSLETLLKITSALGYEVVFKKVRKPRTPKSGKSE
jgi:transcriptional regulator with XRE-family HTH domain